MGKIGVFTKSVILALFLSFLTFVNFYGGTPAFAEASIGSGNWHIKAFQGVETVTWDFGAKPKEVVLTRNGSEIARGGGQGHFEFKNVPPDSNDVFVLSATGVLDENRVEELANKWGTSQSKVKATVQHISTGTLAIRMPGSGLSSSANATTVLPATTKFRYSTFIADAYMPDPPVACTDVTNSLLQRFVGDNRGPNPDSNKFRTRIDVDIDWNQFSTFYTTKSTGPTRREQYGLVLTPYPHYEWTLNKQAYASKDTMSVARIGSPGWDYLSFSITQDVKDPLCNPITVNGVYFDYKVTISRTGGYQVDGESSIFPTHEVYFQDSNDHIWHTIMVLPTQNWFCLIPGPTAGLLSCTQPHSTFGVY